MQNAHNQAIEKNTEIPADYKAEYKIRTTEEIGLFWKFFGEKVQTLTFANDQIGKGAKTIANDLLALSESFLNSRKENKKISVNDSEWQGEKELWEI